MRTGNTTDGTYLLLLLLPVILSIMTGDYLRRKIISHPVLENNCSRIVCRFAGSFAESVIILAGVITGFFLVSLV